jgi:hypothetical protein
MKMKILLFCFGGLALFLSCNDYAEKEKYLIPDSFRGKVIIFFNQPQGQAKKYEKKHVRVYSIPNNGILTTQFSTNPGFMPIGAEEYFLKNNEGQLTKLPIRYEEGTPTTPSDTVVQIFRMGDGSEETGLQFSCFYVDKYINKGKYFGKGDFEQLKEWNEIKKTAGVK